MRKDPRTNDLAAIHIAKKELRLDDDTYRDLVRRFTGGRADSAARMSAAERRSLLAQFGKLGFVNQAKPQRAWKPARKPQARLVWALWKELGDLGALDNPAREACRAFCAKTAGIEAATDPDFLDAAQLNKVIEGLKAWLAREQAKRGGE
jgi:phage gp16-like protein